MGRVSRRPNELVAAFGPVRDERVSEAHSVQHSHASLGLEGLAKFSVYRALWFSFLFDYLFNEAISFVSDIIST
jgi:hypothetical protein